MAAIQKSSPKKLRGEFDLSYSLILAKNLGDNARTYRSAAFADSELELFFNRNGLDQLNDDGYMVAGPSGRSMEPVTSVVLMKNWGR